jgi:HPt (histidine-containing phosphotransfer) domain-containing protein
MMHEGDVTAGSDDLINWKVFSEVRSALGEHFVRLLGYFREDGIKSVAAIEQAMHEMDSVKLVLPAHTLKGEACQFGADRLALLAEKIEVSARHYVEIRQDPGDLLQQVSALRSLFEQSLAALETESSPLVRRSQSPLGQRGAFGSRL